MSDGALVTLTIQITPEEHETLVQRSHEHGYERVDDYLRALALSEAEDDDPDERSLEDIREGIKQGLREAMRGEYVPLDSLWTDDDDERVPGSCCSCAAFQTSVQKAS